MGMGEQSLVMNSNSACASPPRVKNPPLIQTQIQCPTPEKIAESPITKSHESELTQLPHNYRTAADLLDHMNCSLLLLRLRKRSTTFQNISTQVEVLAKRKFLYRHLAQIKFILPEAIQIDSVLVLDKESQCMKPDMNISLLFDIVKGHCQKSDFTTLRQLFASRLLSFFAMHPEAFDVPEAILPEPFGKRSQIPVLKQLSTDSLAEPKPTIIESELLLEKVCPYPYINRHFSQTVIVSQTEKIQALSSPLLPPADGMNHHGSGSDMLKEIVVLSYNSDGMMEQDVQKSQGKESCSESSFNHSIQPSHPQPSIASSIPESPLVKLTSSANSFLIETPAPLTPKRSMPSYDAKHETGDTQKSTSGYKPAKRVLDFSDLEDDKSALDSTADETACSKIVHQNISTTEKSTADKNFTCSPASKEVGQILGCSDEDCKKTETRSLLCQQMSSCLANLVTVLYGVFKSFNWSSITKEELVHKIIMNNLEILRRKEVEEHIELIERHVPDWIHSKLLSNGVIMYSVKKGPNLDSIFNFIKAEASDSCTPKSERASF